MSLRRKYRIASKVRRARPKPRRSVIPRRSGWREELDSSKLYGRSRYLHELEKTDTRGNV